MSRKKIWMFHPDAGGRTIPETVREDVVRRVNALAARRFKGKYIRLDIRFKGQFCYIDAYQEPAISKSWPPKDWPESREEYYERLRNTPTHLCRLRYFGERGWGFAFYTYRDERYTLSAFPNGEFLGTPEDAFLASSGYLEG